MIIEKGKRYGRTTEEVIKSGYPEDNMTNIKVDNEIVLTGDEVAEMFPNQYVVLRILEYKDIDALSSFTKAIVKYFKCDGPFSAKTAELLGKEHPGDIYISETYYDAGLEGDLLWF